MRVVALTLDYPPRRWIGSEVATHAMLKALQAAGHDVTVVTMTHGDGWVQDGVDVRCGRAEFVRQVQHADVAVTHVELGRHLRRVTCPRVGITHNARPDTGEALAGSTWEMVVHNCRTTADVLVEHRHGAAYLVVRPPVDWRDWQVDFVGRDAITLVNVTGEKGSDVFYELAARMPDRRFVGVIGGYGEPDVRPGVEIVPHGSDMRAVYATTRVLLMPSGHESWGRVAVEAMSSGIPVLATDLPGLAEVLGGTGALIEPEWVDEFERQIRRLDDPVVYTEASVAAVARAKELDPGPELARWVACLEALVENRQGPWLGGRMVTWVNTETGRKVSELDGSVKADRLDRLWMWERVI